MTSATFRPLLFLILSSLVGFSFVFTNPNELDAKSDQIDVEERIPEAAEKKSLVERQPIFEIAAGFGYSFGYGSEGTSPDLPTATFSATLWFSTKFGAGVEYVRGIGQDRYNQVIIDPLEPEGDIYPREYRGQEGLQYYRMMMRYRRIMSERWDFNLGVGILVGGRFRDIVILHAPEGPVSLAPETEFNGFSAELLFGRRLAPHLSVKSGVALDANVETNFVLPTIQMVVDF